MPAWNRALKFAEVTSRGLRDSSPGRGRGRRAAPARREIENVAWYCDARVREVTMEQARVRSNFGATTPKHRLIPGIITDQKTKPGITIDNPVRSAKPRSPVQIRAAPPIHSSKSTRSAICLRRGTTPIVLECSRIRSLWNIAGLVNRRRHGAFAVRVNVGTEIPRTSTLRPLERLINKRD